MEEEQHTQLLLCNTLRAPRGKHAAARTCACAPGNKQAALGVCAKLGFIVVEDTRCVLRQHAVPVCMRTWRSVSHARLVVAQLLRRMHT